MEKKGKSKKYKDTDIKQNLQKYEIIKFYKYLFTITVHPGVSDYYKELAKLTDGAIAEYYASKTRWDNYTGD